MTTHFQSPAVVKFNMFYKRVIFWNQGLHQRTDNYRMYKFSGPDYIWLPTRNSTTLGFRRYKQSRDFRVINYVMALLMLTVRNSQYLSTSFSQNALQTCKNLNTLISLLILNSVEKKKRNGSILTPKF